MIFFGISFLHYCLFSRFKSYSSTGLYLNVWGIMNFQKMPRFFLGCSFATQLTGNNSLPSCIPEESESRKSPWLETTIEPEH